MRPVLRGKNLHMVGWWNGYLVVQFRGRSDQYIYGPNVPEAEHAKILANPFPDALFSKVIRKKFQSYKVPRAA